MLSTGRLFALAAAVSGWLTAGTAPAQTDLERRAIVAVETVWDRAQHAAFVDMVAHRGALWCAFREGSRHVPGTNGVIRILRGSPDGSEWRPWARLDEAGVDLRDPKLSVTAEGRLMVVSGGSVYRGKTRVSMAPRVAFGPLPDRTKDGSAPRFTQLSRPSLPPSIASDHDWLWRITWHEGRGYGVVYQPTKATKASKSTTRLHLVGTTATNAPLGSAFERITTLDLAPELRGGETTLRFLDDHRMLALVRCEGGNRHARLGIASPPYTEWTFYDLGVRIGGPELLPVTRPNGKTALLLAGRAYDQGGARTVLWTAEVPTPDRAPSAKRALTLPSGGDNSYPRLLPAERPNRLLCAYYSSHLGRAAVHLATLRLDELLGIR